MREIAFVTLKGLYLFGASLADGCDVLRWRASNQTLSPTLYGVNFEGSQVISSCACLMAFLACCWSSIICLRRSFTDGEVEMQVGWCTRGVCPMISSKGVFFVVALGQEL